MQEKIQQVMKKVHKANVQVTCPRCKQTLYAPFDKIYTTIKGACFTCEEDDDLAEKIFEEF